MYGTFNYKGRTQEGTCNDWTTYTEEELFLPFDFVSYDIMEAVFGVEEFDGSENITVSSFNCSDRSAIEEVVDALNEASTALVSCEGHEWRVYKCSGNVIFCVDCEAKCSSTETCPGERLAQVHPCKNEDTCAELSQEQASFAAVRFGFVETILYPQFRAPLVTNSSATTIDVTFNVSRAGIIYCAALLSTTTLTSRATVQQDGLSQVVLDPTVLYTLRIQDLQPETEYDVYCLTADLDDNLMILQTALDFAVSETTLCCRAVTFDTADGIELPSSQLSSFDFTFSLTSQPIEAIALSLTVALAEDIVCSVNQSSLTSSLPTVSPATVQFAAFASSLTRSFRLSGDAGCYYVTASDTGMASFTYESDTLQVTLLGDSAAVRPPQVSSAQFSNDGRLITLKLDSDSDFGATVIEDFDSTFDCSQLLQFASATVSDCLWLSASEVQVTVGSITGDNIEPGDTIEVLPNVIKASCSDQVQNICVSFLYATSASLLTTTVEAPFSPVAPVAMFTVPKRIGACDFLSIDPTNSFGRGLRPWSSVVWSVVGGSLTTGQSTAIANRLNTNFATTDEIAVLPFNDFSLVGSLTLRLVVTTFLGQSSAAERTTSILSELAAPIVTLTGTTNVFRWQTIRVQANAELSSCATNSSAVTYDWLVYQGTKVMPGIVSVSPDPSLFKLDPYTLDETGTTYSVVLTASANGERSVVTRTINVGVSEVEAQLAGGSERTVSSTLPITLDASLSTDVDFPSSELTYSWECTQIAPNFGSDCTMYQDVFDAAPSSAVLTLPALNESSVPFIPDSIYSVTATATSADGSRSDTVTSELQIVDFGAPVLVIGAVETKYNVDDRVVLECAVSSSSLDSDAITVTWSAPTFDLDAVAATPTALNLSATAESVYQLAIAPNTLIAGRTYTLLISAQFASGAFASAAFASFSSVTITMNTPPIGGELTVTPSTGYEMNTTFRFATGSWSDDSEDYPLLYSFSYYIDDTPASSETYVKAPGQRTIVDTVLGKGLEANDFAVFCVAYAQDIYGAAGSTSGSTQVLSVDDIDALESAVTSLLDEALFNNDAKAVAQASAAAATSLAAANCSAAPDCAALNRESCYAVAQTCGECLDGYVGLDGDSNVACGLTGEIFGVGAACTANNECISGSCFNSTICVDTEKICPNDCSGNGECELFETGSGMVLSVNETCLNNDASCYVECTCSDGFVGSDCGTSEDDLRRRRLGEEAIKDAVCSSLAATAAVQEVSVDVIVTRANTVGSLALDPELISLSALELCASVLLDTVEEYPLLVGDDDAFDPVINALSTLLELEEDLSMSLLANISQAITTAAFGRQQIVAVDETATKISTANLRLVTSRNLITTATSTLFTAPQTAAEVLNGDGATTVSMDIPSVPANGTSDVVGVTIIQYTGNVRGVLANSTSVEARVFYFENTSTYDVVSTVVLQNREPIDYTIYGEADVIEVECKDARSDDYIITAICPDDTVQEVICPGGRRFGTVEVSCPLSFRTPTCQFFDGITYVENENCEVVAFDSDSTTCECTSSPPVFNETSGVYESARRSLASVDDEGGQLVSTDFASSFSIDRTALVTSGPFGRTRIEPSNHYNLVQITLGMFLLVLMLILIWTMWRDYTFAASSGGAAKQGGGEGGESPDAIMSATADEMELPYHFRSFKQFFASLLPLEFQNVSTFQAYLAQLRLSHGLSVFTTSGLDKGVHGGSDFYLLTERWVVTFIKIFNYFFVNVLLAVGLYSDDEECQDRRDKASCEGTERTNAITSTCSWDSHKRSCTYGRENDSFVSIVSIVLILIPVVVIMDRLIRIMVSHAKVALRKIMHGQDNSHHDEQGAGSMRSISKVGGDKKSDLYSAYTGSDEMRAVQTPQGTMYRAASVLLMAREMDYPNVDDEIHRINALLAMLAERNGGGEVPRYARDMLGGASCVSQENYLEVKRQLMSSRANAADLCEVLQDMHSDYARDELMIKSFLLSALSGNKLLAADTVLFGDERLEAEREQRTLLQYFSLMFLPIYFIILIVVTFNYGAAIGHRAAIVWIISFFVALLEEFLLLQPLDIWIRRVSVPAIAKKDFLSWYCVLSVRARSLLSRSDAHLLRAKKSLLQHFNAVCRTGRALPHLASSRLLMSLCDGDLPTNQLVQEQQGSSVGVVESLLTGIYTTVLTSLLYLPEWSRAIVVQFSIGILFNLTLILLFYTSVGTTAATVVAVILLVCLLFVIWQQIRKQSEAGVIPNAEKRFKLHDFIPLPPTEAEKRKQQQYDQMLMMIKDDDVVLTLEDETDDAEAGAGAGAKRALPDNLQLEEEPMDVDADVDLAPKVASSKSFNISRIQSRYVAGHEHDTLEHADSRDAAERAALGDHQASIIIDTPRSLASASFDFDDLENLRSETRDSYAASPIRIPIRDSTPLRTSAAHKAVKAASRSSAVAAAVWPQKDLTDAQKVLLLRKAVAWRRKAIKRGQHLSFVEEHVQDEDATGAAAGAAAGGGKGGAAVPSLDLTSTSKKNVSWMEASSPRSASGESDTSPRRSARRGSSSWYIHEQQKKEAWDNLTNTEQFRQQVQARLVLAQRGGGGGAGRGRGLGRGGMGGGGGGAELRRESRDSQDEGEREEGEGEGAGEEKKD